MGYNNYDREEDGPKKYSLAKMLDHEDAPLIQYYQQRYPGHTRPQIHRFAYNKIRETFYEAAVEVYARRHRYNLDKCIFSLFALSLIILSAKETLTDSTRIIPALATGGALALVWYQSAKALDYESTLLKSPEAARLVLSKLNDNEIYIHAQKKLAELARPKKREPAGPRCPFIKNF